MTKDEATAGVNAKLLDRNSAADPRIDAAALREAMRIVLEYSGYISDLSLPNNDAVPTIPVSAPGEGRLALRGNKLSGQSDLAIVNTNVASIGMTFWKKVTGAADKLLLSLIDGNVGIGTSEPGERLNVAGRIISEGLVAGGPAPTVSKLGVGLGGTGTVTLAAASTDWLGQILLETGSDPQGGANQTFARINFSSARPRIPRGCLLSATNAAACSVNNKVFLVADSVNSMVLLANSNGDVLPANTKFLFTYQVVI